MRWRYGFAALAVSLLGIAAWYVVNGVECRSETRASGTPQDTYCSLHGHYVALIVPGLLMYLGSTIARKRQRAWLMAAAAIASAVLALSPIIASSILRG
jgi:hypothetical protein